MSTFMKNSLLDASLSLKYNGHPPKKSSNLVFFEKAANNLKCKKEEYACKLFKSCLYYRYIYTPNTLQKQTLYLKKIVEVSENYSNLIEKDIF